MIEPSLEQQLVIDAPLAPLAVTACAGSGKTATAVQRLVEMRRRRRPPTFSSIRL